MLYEPEATRRLMPPRGCPVPDPSVQCFFPATPPLDNGGDDSEGDEPRNAIDIDSLPDTPAVQNQVLAPAAYPNNAQPRPRLALSSIPNIGNVTIAAHTTPITRIYQHMLARCRLIGMKHAHRKFMD